jgi:very-short-patch-repair endonuclease
VDFAYPDARVAIEYDSDEHHSGHRANRRDRARRHALIAAGWLPIDVGPSDLRRGATGACAAIAEALRRRSGVKSPA